MKNARIIGASLLLTPLLMGCDTMLAQTFFAHYRMPELYVTQIALTNAAVNLCLERDAINKNQAYAFSNVSAQLLDISVMDKDFYKTSYQDFTNRLSQGLNGANARAECAKVEELLPERTQKAAQLYMQVSSELSMARAQERREMATMLSNFGNNWSQASYAVPSYSWPNVKYVEAQPSQVLKTIL